MGSENKLHRPKKGPRSLGERKREGKRAWGRVGKGVGVLPRESHCQLLKKNYIGKKFIFTSHKPNTIFSTKDYAEPISSTFRCNTKES